MTIPAHQFIPAAPGAGGEIPAQCRFVLPCLVPDFAPQVGSDGRRRPRRRLVPLFPNAGGTTTLRQLIGGGGRVRGAERTRYSAANNDSRKRPRTMTGKPRKPDFVVKPESPVSVSDNSGPESEDSEPCKRVRRSEPELQPAAVAAELQLFPTNERCTPVPVRIDNNYDEKNKEEISTELTLFDESWQAGHSDPRRTRIAPAKQSESETWRKLARMKRYTREDEEEEKEKGVSTKLHLYEDPWTIRQKLKPMEVQDPNPMLALQANAGRHVAGLLTKEDLAKLVNDRTVRMRLWDVDTESQYDVELLRRGLWVGSEMHWVVGFAGDWGPEFVRRRGLEEGDEIGLNWDDRHSRFNFRLIARAAGGD